MSGDLQIIVRISPMKPSLCFALAQETESWLHARGIIGGRTDDNRWDLGPRWREACSPVDESIIFPVADTGVKIETERRFYGGPGDDAACARCGIPMADDFGSLIEDWLDNGEPTVTCSNCGASAPMGDWPSDQPIGYVGAPAVSFYNYHRLKPDFVDEVSIKLGERTRYLSFRL